MLAGLPKAPVAPTTRSAIPTRARARQLYIIERMEENGFITAEQAEAAKKRGTARSAPAPTARRVHAEYVAETVRQLVYAQYGDETYTRGLNVYTTVKCRRPGRRLQGAAQGHHGLRAAPDLPRAREVRRPADRRRRNSTTRSTTRWPNTPTTAT